MKRKLYKAAALLIALAMLAGLAFCEGALEMPDAGCAQTSWVKDDGISTIGIALQEEVPSHL